VIHKYANKLDEKWTNKRKEGGYAGRNSWLRKDHAKQCRTGKKSSETISGGDGDDPADF